MQRTLSVVVFVALITLGVLALVPSQGALAATSYTWSGNADGHTWTNQKNWNPSSGTPQDGDTVTIDGNWTINSVPTISLVSLSLSGPEMIGNSGPVLVGPNSTITTQVLNWSGRGRVAASIVVNQLGQLSNITAPGPILDNGSTALGNPPVTFTNNGVVIQTGTFGLSPGAGAGPRILNEGKWSAVGGTTIGSGSCCGDSTGTIENDGTVAVTGKLVLDHAKFVAQHNSELEGLPGTLEVRGGLAQLAGPWSVNGGAKLELTSNAKVNIGGTTKVGGEIQQEDTSEIQGTGIFDGRGKYRWLGGRILGNLTIGSNLTGVIEGPSAPARELSSAIGAGVLTVDGKVNQTSDVLMNGKIVNKGTWHVPTDVKTAIGAGGLGTPPKEFRNAETIKVDGGAELSLKLRELSNPTDKFTIGGKGRAIWERGTIVGDLTTGKDVDLFLPTGTGPIALDGATSQRLHPRLLAPPPVHLGEIRTAQGHRPGDAALADALRTGGGCSPRRARPRLRAVRADGRQRPTGPFPGCTRVRRRHGWRQPAPVRESAATHHGYQKLFDLGRSAADSRSREVRLEVPARHAGCVR
jgi:hypothetical protein